MKLALLSDLHANLAALEACLAHARQQGATDFAILGDLVGYGAQPREVVALCQELQAQGARIIQGNHDAMAGASNSAALPARSPIATAPQPTTYSWGYATAAWTREQLSASDREWLTHLPMTAQLDRIYLAHASAHQPERWYYVEDERRAEQSLQAAQAIDPGIRYIFSGHVHHQRLFYRSAQQRVMLFQPTAGVPIPVPAHRHWVATIGSVGQPRDGNPKAMYALFDLTQSTLCFHRVGYDHAATAQSIRLAGLPESLAKRIESGT